MDLHQTVEQIKDLAEATGFSPDRIIGMARSWPAYYLNPNGYRHVWESLSGDQEAAEEYLDSLPEDEALEEAALALASAGWTRSSICFRLS